METLLLRRARAGDRDAFARLVHRHREAVYRAAYWILSDREDALDATQEAFLRAYRYLGSFDGRSSFATWLRRIATNAALDRRERRRRERESTQGLPEEDLLGDGRGEGAEERVEREERRRLVREAIEALPPAQRAAVLLRDVEGRSYAEISAALGIPRGTVMSRLYYGRQNLRRKLEALFGPRAEALALARAREEEA